MHCFELENLKYWRMRTNYLKVKGYGAVGVGAYTLHDKTIKKPPKYHNLTDNYSTVPTYSN
jgi:hypothetical protein